MVRLFYPKKLKINKQFIIVDRKQLHYLCHVLRISKGDEIFLFDGKGTEYRCRIEKLSKTQATFLVKDETRARPSFDCHITIACALPKQKAKFDDLVDKLTQLGAERIIPMITERVVLRWDDKQKAHHLKRWKKIAQQACIQCARSRLPVIEPVMHVDEIIAASKSYKLKLIPALIGKRKALKEIVVGSLPNHILILVGPEGDFSEEELTRARERDFIPISLGQLVLRVDTAAIAVTSFFQLFGS